MREFLRTPSTLPLTQTESRFKKSISLEGLDRLIKAQLNKFGKNV